MDFENHIMCDESDLDKTRELDVVPDHKDYESPLIKKRNFRTENQLTSEQIIALATSPIWVPLALAGVVLAIAGAVLATALFCAFVVLCIASSVAVAPFALVNNIVTAPFLAFKKPDRTTVENFFVVSPDEDAKDKSITTPSDGNINSKDQGSDKVSAKDFSVNNKNLSINRQNDEIIINKNKWANRFPTRKKNFIRSYTYSHPTNIVITGPLKRG